MDSGIVIGTVFVLVALSFISAISTTGEASGTTERDWMNSGDSVTVTQDYTAPLIKYIRVNTSDVVTVNWESGGNINSGYLYVKLLTSCSAINFSTSANDGRNIVETTTDSGTGGGSIPVSSLGYSMEYAWTPESYLSTHPMMIMWVRVGSDSVIQLRAHIVTNSDAQTINITVNDSESYYSKITNSINDNITKFNNAMSALNNTTTALQNYTSLLNNSITELQNYTQWENQSIRENLSTIDSELYNLIIFLTNEQANILSDMNASESKDIAALQTQIASLNTSLIQTISSLDEFSNITGANVTGLTNQLYTLSSQIDAINTNFPMRLEQVNTTLSNEILSIPYYNDVSLWSELGNLSAVLGQISQPGNNTTVIKEFVNQTVVNQTLVNQTVVQNGTITNITKTVKENADITLAVIMGALMGAVFGGVVGGVMNRKKKQVVSQIVLEKKELPQTKVAPPPVQPAESIEIPIMAKDEVPRHPQTTFIEIKAKTTEQKKKDMDVQRENSILKALSSLPRGLPSTLWGTDIDEIAAEVAHAETKKSPEGDKLVKIDNRWYYGDESNLGLFMQKYEK